MSSFIVELPGELQAEIARRASQTPGGESAWVADAVREKLDRNALSDASQLKREIKSHIIRILTMNEGKTDGTVTGSAKAASAQTFANSTNGFGPRVIFIVGVNGAGKTTSIGKLANRLRQEGLSVVLCAADTFRAAAVEQLEIWAQRNGIDVIKQKSGADPAAVVYDAMAAAKAILAASPEPLPMPLTP